MGNLINKVEFTISIFYVRKILVRLHLSFFTIFRKVDHRSNFISIFLILATDELKLKPLLTCLLSLRGRNQNLRIKEMKI